MNSFNDPDADLPDFLRQHLRQPQPIAPVDNTATHWCPRCGGVILTLLSGDQPDYSAPCRRCPTKVKP